MTDNLFAGYGNYDKFPKKKIDCTPQEVQSGWTAICEALAARHTGRTRTVIAVECYPGIDMAELQTALSAIPGARLFNAEECALPSEELDRFFAPNLTDDRVFGRMTTGKLEECFSRQKLTALKAEVEAISQGIAVVYGTGASLVTKGDFLAYCDLARWEIQLRYRKGMGNWHSDNGSAPQLSKYKRGYFIEWRLADRQKEKLLPELDYLIDCNTPNQPAMVSGGLLRRALDRFAREPFRTVPYFDPGPWGGQWMKNVCGLDASAENYAWSFDGVPEENSLLLDCGGTVVQLPAMNLILYRPKALLGERVYGRFGAEFPIRFDFLDTMSGGNLSLQVHPLTSYIQNTFGMHYTQDESYYFLDCGEDAAVYLGVKSGVSPAELINALEQAQQGKDFDAERYINRFPVKKHDHVLIPAGTIHCSGQNGMVLEVSATPYIFTFKLYDWGRLGMDGLPRPIHLEHGKQVIQWDRDTEWVQEHLLHQEKLIFSDAHCQAEKTGLHALEPIATTRFWFDEAITLSTDGGVNMLNLVEGAEVRIESPEGAFPNFSVHYAETFILPASASEYRVVPVDFGKASKCALLRAEVRA